MTIEEAKKIAIVDYLYSLGHTPVKQQGSSLWYKSPLREEKEPSFKVTSESYPCHDVGNTRGYDEDTARRAYE